MSKDEWIESQISKLEYQRKVLTKVTGIDNEVTLAQSIILLLENIYDEKEKEMTTDQV